jgi:hypothetical protein
MIFSTATILAAILAMVPLCTHAHAVIANPVPFGTPTRDPLEPDGSNFPCKSVPYDTITPINDWPVGSTQMLAFQSNTSAVHGGGSCQISVTTDKAPTKDSKWKVIHSFEGGCPMNPVGGGNLPEFNGTNLDQIPHLPYQIPPELPNGDMVMAWTWFNKVGNREMYMNCGPVKVSGGASDTTEFDKLPDMAIANLAGHGTCTTTEGGDYFFEDPGKYVTKGNGTTLPIPLCGGAPSGGAGAGGNTGAPAAPVAPAPAPANPSIPAPVPSQPASSPAAGGTGGLTSAMRTIVTVTAPSGPAPTPQKPAQSPAPAPPASKSPAAAPPHAPAAPSQAPAAPGNAPPAGQACSPNGSVVCSSDGKQFAVCNWGKAVFQPVAQGTTCQGGKIVRRDDFASKLRTVYA